MNPENVLTIPRSAFAEFHGFTPISEIHNPGRYLTAHPNETNLASFVPRDEAETSEDRIQILPYCLLVCGQDIFLYSRNKKGGETRLHDKLSVGVGGHINDEDHPDDTYRAYLDGTLRELREEVGLEIPVEALWMTLMGMLHDTETPVGRVHLGCVHVIHISPAQAQAVLLNAEDTKTDPRFTSIQELAGNPEIKLALEPWSQWALEHLTSLMAKPKPWETPAVRERLHLLNIAAAEVARSSGELLMQDKGREWTVGRDNLESALGAITCMLSGLTTNQDLSSKAIVEHSRGYYKQIQQTSRHQDFPESASTQPPL